MEQTSIADEFFESKPEQLNEILKLESRRGLRLASKLRVERDTINFFSRLTEIRFGLFFDPLCSDLRYDFPIGYKRPDWNITMNGQQIIGEALRLNSPEEECRMRIEQNRRLRRFQKEHPGVPIITRSGVKSVSLEYLGGGQTKMAVKEEKYRTIIEQHQLPFIICVAPSLDTYLSELDFSDFLIGRRGVFARDEFFGRNVTGVLLHTFFGHFFYFPNERAQYPLNERNRQVMTKWIYRE